MSLFAPSFTLNLEVLPLTDVIRSLNPNRFYTMEESEGTLNDQGSDNGKATPVNTLTYRQRSILPKRNGASILFGATGHFSLVTNFTYKSDFTLAFPVKFKENPGATSTIFAQYHTNASAGGILIFVGTDGVLHADGKVPTSSTYEANAGTRNVCDNNEHWCTIIVVNNEVKIYIDGELDVISSGGSFNNGTYYNTNAYIGQLNNSNYWKSSLQYLAMWNKALSEDQAKYMARAAINDMPKAAPTYTEANLLKEPNLWVPKKKPIGPVKIDWAHELTDGLIGFWILNRSQTCNLVNNLPATIRGSTGSISPYAGEGDTYHNTGAASSGYETYDNMGTNATTVAARVELVGGSNNYIASHTWPGSGSMPWNLAPTPLSWGFSMYTGSVWQKSGVSTNIIGAGMTDVGGRGWFNGTNMTLEYLVDGNVDSTIDVTGTTMVRNGTAEFVIGAYAPSSYGINGHLSYIAVWNKRLTLEAFRNFQKNPYQFLTTL